VVFEVVMVLEVCNWWRFVSSAGAGGACSSGGPGSVSGDVCNSGDAGGVGESNSI